MILALKFSLLYYELKDYLQVSGRSKTFDESGLSLSCSHLHIVIVKLCCFIHSLYNLPMH